MKLKFPAGVNNCIKISTDILQEWLASNYPWSQIIESWAIMAGLDVSREKVPGDTPRPGPVSDSTSQLNTELTDWRYLLIRVAPDHCSNSATTLHCTASSPIMVLSGNSSNFSFKLTSCQISRNNNLSSRPILVSSGTKMIKIVIC